MLAADNCPQHRTLCEFRRRHLEDFQALFVEVVRLAQELGLARLGKLSVDGTKVRANASKRKAMSYGRMQEEERRLESEVEALLRKADEVDEAEDSRLGAKFGAMICRRSCVGEKSVWRRCGGHRCAPTRRRDGHPPGPRFALYPDEQVKGAVGLLVRDLPAHWVGVLLAPGLPVRRQVADVGRFLSSNSLARSVVTYLPRHFRRHRRTHGLAGVGNRRSHTADIPVSHDGRLVTEQISQHVRPDARGCRSGHHRPPKIYGCARLRPRPASAPA